MNCLENKNLYYDIIKTGSKGNAVILNDILIDCGVAFKSIEKYIKDLSIVLLTHIHSDHFKRNTIKLIHCNRPSVRFACGEWLVKSLIECGVSIYNIDVMKFGYEYNYQKFSITPFELFHDVENLGYKIHFTDSKVFYATDTYSLKGIEAENYDLYLVESNYESHEIKQKILQKVLNGEYSYEIRASKNHLSKEKCDDFIYKNAGPKSVYVYLHSHEYKDD